MSETDKRALRRQCRELRRHILQMQPQRERALSAALAGWLRDRPCRVIGIYRPYRGEPDVLPGVMEVLTERDDVLLALPVVEDAAGGRMHYALWQPGEALHAGAFGIEEPVQDVLVLPDVILSPVIGFDRRGYRLGSGGGFFDRYLDGLASAGLCPETVAVGFDALELENFTPERHDIPMQWIATESGVRAADNKKAASGGPAPKGEPSGSGPQPARLRSDG